MIKVFVNGVVHLAPAGSTIGQLVEELLLPSKGIAIALNGNVILHSEWCNKTLLDSDKIEVLAIAQGG